MNKKEDEYCSSLQILKVGEDSISSRFYLFSGRGLYSSIKPKLQSADTVGTFAYLQKIFNSF